VATINTLVDQLNDNRKRIEAGGQPKYHEKAKEQHKLFVRERLSILFDEGKYEEDGKFANFQAGDLPADGVVTAIGKING
jgi:methylmalonyl-CoA decarboxylase subunit alpha